LKGTGYLAAASFSPYIPRFALSNSSVIPTESEAKWRDLLFTFPSAKAQEKSKGAPGSPQRTWAEKDGRSPTIAFAELVTAAEGTALPIHLNKSKWNRRRPPLCPPDRGSEVEGSAVLLDQQQR
jgi:hypothetical protein